MKDNWIFYREVNFADENIKQYHVDTRDFHCLTINEDYEDLPNLEKILKHKGNFFYTAEEIRQLIDRYFTDSGGKKDWRFFTLEGFGDWFKYLRIYRTEHGLLICDRKGHALNKEKLSRPVKKDEYTD